MKRLVIISDLHCGHYTGLTHPDYQEIKGKFTEVQKAMWDWYEKKIQEQNHIDFLMVNGDAIEGKGEKSGGTELITSDRHRQCLIAKAAIDYAHADKVGIIYGTPYHTGKDEDWEATLSDMINADILGSHEWIDLEGVIIDFKHKVGSSVIPHGRHTGPSRAGLWNVLWNERGLQPKADIIVRSHVHYHTFCGTPERLIITTPGLQGWTKYGAKECEGTIDIGFIVIDAENGRYEWKAELMQLDFLARQAFKV